MTSQENQDYRGRSVRSTNSANSANGRPSRLPEDRSIGELLGDLYQGTAEILRLEIQLAKTELAQKASRVGKNVGFLAAGGILAYTGFLAIIAGIIGVLALLLPFWASALIVGVIVAGIGGALILKGIKTLQQEQPMPQTTMQTIREDQEWLKDQRQGQRQGQRDQSSAGGRRR